MRIDNSFVARSALALLAATAVIAGCTGGPEGTSPNGQGFIQTSHVRKQADPSAIVRIFNPGTNGPIYGSVSTSCGMTASPSPLPTIGVGDHKKITLDVNGSCGSMPFIGVAYGPGKDGYTCTLQSSYSLVSDNFTYSVLNEFGVDCVTYPAPPSSNYDQEFDWFLCLSNCLDTHRRHVH